MQSSTRPILAASACVLLAVAWRFQDARFESIPVGDGLYMVTSGMGGNVAACVGDDGLLVIDDQFERTAPELLEALKALASQVRQALRPVDHVARYGGEEFVVLLPSARLNEACEALTRVQRALSMSLFLHEGREVFVTFSAGATQWRVGESLDQAVERADLGLYEAKRTGKNRTCTA